MDHSYLRYECADSFGLTTSSGSAQAPQSNSILAFLGEKPSSPLLTTAGSQCVGFNLRQGVPCMKLGHRELLSGGVGTGRGLNSDEVVCMDVCTSAAALGGISKVATGWVDGSVRVFDVKPDETKGKATINTGLVHSLIEDDTDDEFAMREPLLLNGHSQTPVRSIQFDKGKREGTRLASGGSDGSVVLWDIVAETGLFRLLGHRGGITGIAFVCPSGFDGLITSSLDGLVKVWDIDGQCCTQTIASHRGEVWGLACTKTFSSRGDGDKDDGDDSERWRMVTGGSDGQVRVWEVGAPKRAQETSAVVVVDTEQSKKQPTEAEQQDKDTVCTYMGSILAPPNVVRSSDRVSSIHWHPNGRHVGFAQANGKTIDIYMLRKEQEALRKKQRRLRRRREKEAKTSISDEIEKKGKKRGILDDPSSDEEEMKESNKDSEAPDVDVVKAQDEFEYLGTVRASHKTKGFIFAPQFDKGSRISIAVALATNALEVHSLVKGNNNAVTSDKISTIDMYGHPTGIRSVTLSSDDALACTVSKNATKIWNVSSRSCIRSLSPSASFSDPKKSSSLYGLCAIFLPGNVHVALGTREGHLLILDIASGDVVYTEENAHDGAIWALDLQRPGPIQESAAIVTGSADKSVKFWDLDAQDNDGNGPTHPMVVHTRTLKMSDDVVAVRYSYSPDPAKRMVFVSTLDSTIKVFFDDTLKFFLNLYGHKLPALALDASDDDAILASSGADKTIKIWGLDFGDTHRTLHGHGDSITDLRFVKKTHNFFTTSKDGSVRYWDGDRFDQILLLSGHTAEVNCLAVSRTGAFVLSGGMDRQIRVWERTRDMVFVEEEKERALEQIFDKVATDEGGTAGVLSRRGKSDDEDMDDAMEAEELPQSEAAVKRSLLSISAGDRIMECLERADQELKDTATFNRSQTGAEAKRRTPNPLLLGLEPAPYVLWALRSVKSAELEQSLLLLPLNHTERLIFYLIVLLRSGRGIELCSKVAVFLIKAHQNQISASASLAPPLRELKRLVKLRLTETKDTVGFNLAALGAIAKVAAERKNSFFNPDANNTQDVWAGMGFGSDVAAALEKRGRTKR